MDVKFLSPSDTAVVLNVKNANRQTLKTLGKP